MTTHIKKTIKSALLGVAVLGLALGMSAWTGEASEKNANKLSPVRFFNKSGNPNSTNPADYVYDSSGECSDEGNACSAMWEHTGPLTDGTNPNGVKLSPDEPGTYIPGI